MPARRSTSRSIALLRLATVLLSLGVSAGCQLLGGVEVTPVAQTANKPGQVAVYLAVRDDGKPLNRLEAADFKLFENETQLEPSQVQLQLLSRDAVAAHQTLVLVDMSGPIDEPGRRALLIKQLVPFVERLRMQQNVSVYGFDGGEKLHAFGKFDKADEKAQRPNLDGVLKQKQADPSSNLNGAILTAISQLDFELNASAKPLKLGRLVIIARGPDLAGRTVDDRVTERLDQTAHHVFVLGVEQEPNTGFSERVGRDGFAVASSFDNMESQLSELATMVEEDYGQYYLLSYCSPARSGERLLLIEVASKSGDGGENTGNTEIQFSADGFGSGCDGSKVPRFAPVNSASALSSPNAGGAKLGASTSAGGTEPGSTEPTGTEPAAAPSTDADDAVVPPPTSSGYAE